MSQNRDTDGISVFFWTFLHIIRRKRQVTCLRNFGECVLIFLLFFMAAVAVLEIDRVCSRTAGYGGDITASAEFLVEKTGGLG